METEYANVAIPMDVLQKALKDYHPETGVPLPSTAQYGKWEVVEFPEYSHRVPEIGCDPEGGYISNFIFRNSESNRYFRVSLAHDLEDKIIVPYTRIVEVALKLVPVYHDI